MAIQAALNSLATVGGEVFLPNGIYKCNLSIPEGVTIVGESAANLFTTDPKGSVLIANNTSLPIVKINNGSTPIHGAGLRNICINAGGAQTGLYIAGASYINVDKCSIINAADTNIIIECLANNPTYFVSLRSVTTYNASNYNFKVLENLALGGTFTSSIFCENFVSYTQPGKTTAGRIAYIQAQVVASGYWEDQGADIIVIDRSSATVPQGLNGTGLIIDGKTGQNVVKVIPTGNGLYNRLNNYIWGNVSVDGNIYNSVTSQQITGPVGSIQADYSSSGITKTTYTDPIIIGSATGFSYRWYDNTAKALRQKATFPSSVYDGNVVSGAEAGYAAAPTTGTWTRGDVVFNTTPAKGVSIGWVCTASGTPGSWETIGGVGAVENVAALPTADSTQRGKVLTVLAGAGTADKLYICLRSAATTYSWVQIAVG